MDNLSIGSTAINSRFSAAALSFWQDPKPSPPQPLPAPEQNLEYSGKPNKKLSFDEINGDKYAQKAKEYFGIEYKNCKKDDTLTADELSAYMVCEINEDLIEKIDKDPSLKKLAPDQIKYATGDQLAAFAKTAGWNINALIMESHPNTTKGAEPGSMTIGVASRPLLDDFRANKIEIDKIPEIAIRDMERSYARIYPEHRLDGVLDRKEAAPIAFSPPSPEEAVYIKDATAANFEADVIEASRRIPVIMIFGAPWCAQCHFITPIFEKRALAEKGRFTFVKLNVDEAEDITKSYGVKAFPTVMIFKDGQPVGNFVGIKSESEIKKFIDDTMVIPSKKL
jgi:thioredoxin